MKQLNLQGFFAILLAALLAFGPMTTQVQAKTKKGEKLLKEAQAAEVRQEWDKAADLYNQAVDEDPKDVAYMIGMRRARFNAGNVHLEKARELRSQGNMTEAMAELQKAILLDPSSTIVLQEVKHTQEMMANPGGAGQANLTPYERAQKEASDRSASLLSIPDLNPPVKRINPLRMNNQPIRILYNTVAAIAGVNVVIDPSWNGQSSGESELRRGHPDGNGCGAGLRLHLDGDAHFLETGFADHDFRHGRHAGENAATSRIR
ncbi:MAG: hypothetical protein WDO18_11540 [Acidobacteriota bacterium]